MQTSSSSSASGWGSTASTLPRCPFAAGAHIVAVCTDLAVGIGLLHISEVLQLQVLVSARFPRWLRRLRFRCFHSRRHCSRPALFPALLASRIFLWVCRLRFPCFPHSVCHCSRCIAIFGIVCIRIFLWCALRRCSRSLVAPVASVFALSATRLGGSVPPVAGSAKAPTGTGEQHTNRQQPSIHSFVLFPCLSFKNVSMMSSGSAHCGTGACPASCNSGGRGLQPKASWEIPPAGPRAPGVSPGIHQLFQLQDHPGEARKGKPRFRPRAIQLSGHLVIGLSAADKNWLLPPGPFGIPAQGLPPSATSIAKRSMISIMIFKFFPSIRQKILRESSF